MNENRINIPALIADDLEANEFWRQDGFTDDYISQNREKLSDPRSMTPSELGGASTYCRTFWNPYTEELLRRASCVKKFNKARTDAARYAAVQSAARSFGFDLL